MRVEHLGFNENETFLVVTGTQARFNNFLKCFNNGHTYYTVKYLQIIFSVEETLWGRKDAHKIAISSLAELEGAGEQARKKPGNLAVGIPRFAWNFRFTGNFYVSLLNIQESELCRELFLILQGIWKIFTNLNCQETSRGFPSLGERSAKTQIDSLHDTHWQHI